MFPIIALWELSVAMETRVPISSDQKHITALVAIGPLVVEIFMFQNVNTQIYRHTDDGSTGIL